ncbi:membrane protein [Acetobacter aceti 1023]|nr:membrane protein [Acetobacter aceti 1023]
MPIITVVGASGNVQVTVDGAQNSALYNQATDLSNKLSSAISGLTAQNIAPGATDFGTGNQAGYGVITAPGSYQVSGNAQFLSVGSNQPGVGLDGWVNINATGVTPSSNMTVIGGSNTGIAFSAGAQSGTFLAGSGDNVFVGNNQPTAGNWNILSGGGDDTVVSGAGNNTISAGTGHNTIDLGSGMNYVHSDGQDTITATAGRQSVTLSGSSSTVNLSDNSLVIDASGNQHITVGGASTVTGGSLDYINMSGATGTVEGGQNTTISAAHGDLQTENTDSALISAANNLTFIGGTGETTITAGHATIFGSNGLDVHVNASQQGTIDGAGANNLFVANDGNETLDGASSAFGFQAFGNNVGTTGTQTFIGGTASDTLVAGVGNATLEGGSGAANVFGFRNGIAGADYTIQDFGSAAGNSVLLVDYDYTKASFQTDVLDKAITSGNNTTITLSDHSQITFVNVAHLNENQFSGLK